MLGSIVVYGIIWTALYCLIALGFSLLFGVAGILNLAHGMVIMTACYAVFLLVTMAKLSLGISIVIGIVFTTILLLGIYLIFVEKLLDAPHTSMLLLTGGLALILHQAVILLVGPQTSYVPSMITGSSTLLSTVIPNQAILSVIIAFSLIGLLFLFLRNTKTGRAIRAVSQDRDTAAISGIDTEKIYWITIIITGILAAMAGILVAPLQSLTPDIGWELMVTAFTVTILAGLGGPIWGTLVAAAIVAYAELFTAFFISPMLKQSAGFIIMILTLMFRPAGLFGKGRM